MGWERVYDALMHPLEALSFRPLRRALIPRARGRVLEIGAGTGANLPYYRWERIDELHLLDLELARDLDLFVPSSGVPVVLHDADAQSLPFAGASFDTVVCTLVLCSVADPALGLAEVMRVLDPRGTLIFIEHVKPVRRAFASLVDAANPLWQTIMAPCNLNRDTVAAIRDAGFAVDCVRGGMIAAGIGRPSLAPGSPR